MIHVSRRVRRFATALFMIAALASLVVLSACSNGSAETLPSPTASAAPPVAHNHTESPAPAGTTGDTSDSATMTQTALYTAMAHLWAQHMEWTYATVADFVSGSPSLDATLARLLQNQTDIGNAVKAFYGDAAGDQLGALLTTHINDAVPVLQAAKAGDTAALDKANADWYANANEIADFLVAANPSWDKADMEEMMKTHITQTLAYASDLLQGNYQQAIADFDTAEQHMFEMSDMLSEGIIAQFPDKFSSAAPKQ